MNNGIRFIRHDRDNETTREVTETTVSKALGAFLLERLVANAARSQNACYAVEAHGYVWEARRQAA